MFWYGVNDNTTKRDFYSLRGIAVAHEKSDLPTGIILISHGIDDGAIKKQNKHWAFHDYSKCVLLADRLSIDVLVGLIRNCVWGYLSRSKYSLLRAYVLLP